MGETCSKQELTEQNMKIKIDARELYQVLDAAAGYRNEGLINLMQDKILLRMHEEANTALYACLVPESAMIEYSRGEYNRLGVDIEDLKSLIPNREGDTVTLERDGAKLLVQAGSREYRIGLIDPDNISGVPEQNPTLDLPITVRGSPEWLLNFTNDAYQNIHGKDDDDIYFSCRDGLLYLWSHEKTSGNEIADRFHWEDFDDYSIDWSKADKCGVADEEIVKYDPVDDHVVNTMMSSTFIRPIVEFDDAEARVEIGNWGPIKIVYETTEGVKHSWMIPPRIPEESQVSAIPQRIIKDRSVT